MGEKGYTSGEANLDDLWYQLSAEQPWLAKIFEKSMGWFGTASEQYSRTLGYTPDQANQVRNIQLLQEFRKIAKQISEVKPGIGEEVATKMLIRASGKMYPEYKLEETLGKLETEEKIAQAAKQGVGTFTQQAQAEASRFTLQQSVETQIGQGTLKLSGTGPKPQLEPQYTRWANFDPTPAFAEDTKWMGGTDRHVPYNMPGLRVWAAENTEAPIREYFGPIDYTRIEAVEAKSARNYDIVIDKMERWTGTIPPLDNPDLRLRYTTPTGIVTGARGMGPANNIQVGQWQGGAYNMSNTQTSYQALTEIQKGLYSTGFATAAAAAGVAAGTGYGLYRGAKWTYNKLFGKDGGGGGDDGQDGPAGGQNRPAGWGQQDELLRVVSDIRDQLVTCCTNVDPPDPPAPRPPPATTAIAIRVDWGKTSIQVRDDTTRFDLTKRPPWWTDVVNDIPPTHGNETKTETSPPRKKPSSTALQPWEPPYIPQKAPQKAPPKRPSSTALQPWEPPIVPKKTPAKRPSSTALQPYEPPVRNDYIRVFNGTQSKIPARIRTGSKTPTLLPPVKPTAPKYSSQGALQPWGTQGTETPVPSDLLSKRSRSESSALQIWQDPDKLFSWEGPDAFRRAPIPNDSFVQFFGPLRSVDKGKAVEIKIETDAPPLIQQESFFHLDIDSIPLNETGSEASLWGSCEATSVATPLPPDPPPFQMVSPINVIYKDQCRWIDAWSQEGMQCLEPMVDLVVQEVVNFDQNHLTREQNEWSLLQSQYPSLQNFHPNMVLNPELKSEWETDMRGRQALQQLTNLLSTPFRYVVDQVRNPSFENWMLGLMGGMTAATVAYRFGPTINFDLPIRQFAMRTQADLANVAGIIPTLIEQGASSAWQEMKALWPLIATRGEQVIPLILESVSRYLSIVATTSAGALVGASAGTFAAEELAPRAISSVADFIPTLRRTVDPIIEMIPKIQQAAIDAPDQLLGLLEKLTDHYSSIPTHGGRVSVDDLKQLIAATMLEGGDIAAALIDKLLRTIPISTRISHSLELSEPIKNEVVEYIYEQMVRVGVRSSSFLKEIGEKMHYEPPNQVANEQTYPWYNQSPVVSKEAMNEAIDRMLQTYPWYNQTSPEEKEVARVDLAQEIVGEQSLRQLSIWSRFAPMNPSDITCRWELDDTGTQMVVVPPIAEEPFITRYNIPEYRMKDWVQTGDYTVREVRVTRGPSYVSVESEIYNQFQTRYQEEYSDKVSIRDERMGLVPVPVPVGPRERFSESFGVYREHPQHPGPTIPGISFGNANWEQLYQKAASSGYPSVEDPLLSSLQRNQAGMLAGTTAGYDEFGQALRLAMDHGREAAVARYGYDPIGELHRLSGGAGQNPFSQTTLDAQNTEYLSNEIGAGSGEQTIANLAIAIAGVYSIVNGVKRLEASDGTTEGNLNAWIDVVKQWQASQALANATPTVIHFARNTVDMAKMLMNINQVVPDVGFIRKITPFLLTTLPGILAGADAFAREQGRRWGNTFADYLGVTPIRAATVLQSALYGQEITRVVTEQLLVAQGWDRKQAFLESNLREMERNLNLAQLAEMSAFVLSTGGNVAFDALWAGLSPFPGMAKWAIQTTMSVSLSADPFGSKRVFPFLAARMLRHLSVPSFEQSREQYDKYQAFIRLNVQQDPVTFFERIDTIHRLEDLLKLVKGPTPEATDEMQDAIALALLGSRAHPSPGAPNLTPFISTLAYLDYFFQRKGYTLEEEGRALRDFAQARKFHLYDACCGLRSSFLNLMLHGFRMNPFEDEDFLKFEWANPKVLQSYNLDASQYKFFGGQYRFHGNYGASRVQNTPNVANGPMIQELTSVGRVAQREINIVLLVMEQKYGPIHTWFQKENS